MTKRIQIVLDISEPFIEDWEKDRFDDALDRIAVDVEYALSKHPGEQLAGKYELETIQYLIKAFKQSRKIEESTYARDILREIIAECWACGMNMTGEYQGVWIRYRDIEKAIYKYLPKEDQKW